MKTKTTLIAASFLIFSFGFPRMALNEATPSGSGVGNFIRQKIEQFRTNKTSQLRHTMADKEIDRRVAELNRLIGFIGKVKHITVEQKAALTAEVQTGIIALQNLKAKIAADTDPETLKADKKSIAESYRTFLLFVPKIRIIAYADRILNIAAEMRAKNPPADAAAKINDAIAEASKAISTVMPLEPSGWPENRTNLISARQMLKTAHKDLLDAWKIIRAVKVTPTATPTPTE